MNPRKRTIARRLLPGCLVALLAWPAAEAYLAEPETLVYGRILNRDNANVDHLVTEGQLRWTIRRPDGTSIQLSGEVDELDGGNYSYLLRIPHQAMVLGQEPSGRALPLGASEQTAVHEAISLDGIPASILPPATSAFGIEMILRASAIRVDLEITTEAVDGDGDGIPDWWEDRHGLDKQDPDDALADANGNGLNNLGEFLAGSDPALDSRLPRLVTGEVIAYSSSSSLVLLEALDSDSSPAQLVFKLHTAPRAGRLLLRNAAALPGPTELELAAGAEFSQADVLAGRLVYQHDGSGSPGTIEVGVRDEDPAHAEASGAVEIRLFDPQPGSLAASPEEAMRLEAHRLASEHGYLVADLGATSGIHRLSAATAGMSESDYRDHLASYGPERPHILLGGPSGDEFRGGAADDSFHGNAGANRFSGGGGADQFLFTGGSDDEQAIADFDPASGDVIDLAGALDGASRLLTDYVRIRRSGGDALLEICADGTAAGFNDLVVRLLDSPLESSDLAGLHYAGSLLTGDIGLPPRFGIEATTPLASENGPVDGVFTITREGDVDLALSVQLRISGNAVNGVDYQNLPGSVSFPAGVVMVELAVRPYVDAAVEFSETVFIELLESPDYLLAARATAQMTIEDLKPQIALEVIEGLASVDDGAPGALLMRRAGLLSPEVFVQFSLAGTAVNGIDYDHVAPYLSLSAGQTTRLIEFRPKSGVDFGDAEAKNIRVSVLPDNAYSLAEPDAEVLIVPRRVDYASWLAEHGLSPDGGGAGGTPLLTRYGFAVDPRQPNAAESMRRMPRAVLDDGYLTIHFRRKPALTDLLYRVEYSNDFNQWFGGPDYVEEITSQVAPDDPGAAVFRARTPISGAAAAGLRVRLELPANP